METSLVRDGIIHFYTDSEDEDSFTESEQAALNKTFFTCYWNSGRYRGTVSLYSKVRSYNLDASRLEMY